MFPRNRIVPAHVALALLALPQVASAQRLLSSYTAPTGFQIRTLRPAGDTNGDGEIDFVVMLQQSLPTIVVQDEQRASWFRRLSIRLRRRKDRLRRNTNVCADAGCAARELGHNHAAGRGSP